MASLFKQADGGWRVEYSISKDSPRGYVRLGKVTRNDATTAHVWISKLVSAKAMRATPDAETARWVAGIGDTLHEKLAKAGLIEPREGSSLGTFLDKALATFAVKPATAVFYGHAVRNMKEYFGVKTPLRNIKVAEVDGYKAWLAGEQKLSGATVARRIVAARYFFKIAKRWGLVDENYFVGIKGGKQSNADRLFYVTPDTVAKILDACPDIQWRCIIALSRYAGIRVPSELLPLRWTDINWESGTMLIHSPKTEHHEGGETRTIPLFAELKPYLLEAFEKAEDGSEYIITAYRDTTQNLRTQFERIALRAGVAMWAKPFHNMRASRESELMRAYDLATVCKWIGNSPAIAAQHYAQSVDRNSDVRRASGMPEPSEVKNVPSMAN